MADDNTEDNKEVVIQGLVSDNEPLNIRIDTSTRAMMVIEYAHHEIHSGDSFTWSESTDVGASTDFDLVVTTPNTTTWAHMTYSIISEAEGEIQIYENCTPTTDGTARTPLNRNRNSAGVATATVQRIPTLATPGSLIEVIHFGSGKSVGGDNREASEWILKQNEDYLFRVINATSSANQMTIKFDWYEHEDKS